MTWRGRTTQQDRIFACLVYLVPMLEVLPMGGIFLDNFPILGIVLLPLLYLLRIYSFPFVSFAIFIALYILVVRNEKLRHFLRFNTMQALLLAIIVYLYGLILSLIGFVNPLRPQSLSTPINPLEILNSAVFLGIFAASVYSIVRCVRGLYAEMPIVSEAAYVQTR